MTNFAWCTSTSIRSLSAICIKFHVTYKLITLRLYLHQYKYFFYHSSNVSNNTAFYWTLDAISFQNKTLDFLAVNRWDNHFKCEKENQSN